MQGRRRFIVLLLIPNILPLSTYPRHCRRSRASIVLIIPVILREIIISLEAPAATSSGPLCLLLFCVPAVILCTQLRCSIRLLADTTNTLLGGRGSSRLPAIDHTPTLLLLLVVCLPIVLVVKVVLQLLSSRGLHCRLRCGSATPTLLLRRRLLLLV